VAVPVPHDVLADFADRFARFWAAPEPEALAGLLAETVHLEAPLMPTTDGLAAAMQAFSDLLAGMPDLTGEVHRWGPHDDGLFIEFTLHFGRDDGAPAVRAVDDFLVGADGLATERISYFDPSPLLSPS
jgi:hypothetical protein